MLAPSSTNQHGIDAVVTWVDGQDPLHAERMRPYLDGKQHGDGVSKTRFADAGELRFCLASLEVHAPYLRRIFIVTDAQSPDYLPLLLKRLPSLTRKVELVDHTTVFDGYRHVLPTFSSLTIEAVLHRIPGLSERFVYFNDDVFLTRDAPPRHFFTTDGPVLRGRWKRFGEDRLSYRLKRLIGELATRERRPSFVKAQQDAARRVSPGSRYLQFAHTPHPLRKSTLRRVYDGDPTLFAQQISYRFRHAEQLSTIALANHAEIAAGTARIILEERAGYLKAKRASPAAVGKLFRKIEAGKFDSICLQSMDMMHPAVKAELSARLEERYGLVG